METKKETTKKKKKKKGATKNLRPPPKGTVRKHLIEKLSFLLFCLGLARAIGTSTHTICLLLDYVCL